jgi:cysteine-rich repeat protein
MIDAQRPSWVSRERHVTLKKCTWFTVALAAALCGCDDGVAGGSPRSTTDSAAPVQRSDAAAQHDAAPPTVDCDEAPNGTPCGAPGSGKHCVLEACLKNSCGDGIVVEEDNEACDDGNEDDGDGCSARCDEETPGAAADAGSDAGSDAATAQDASMGADASSGVDASTSADAASGSADAATDAAASADSSTSVDAAIDSGNTGTDAALQAGHDAGADAEGHQHDAEADAAHDAASVDGGVPQATCASCAAASCKMPDGDTQVDLQAGCFSAINPAYGANTADPAFIQDCIDTVACARQHGCGFTAQFQAAECYCGTNAGDACTTVGPAANAPCLAQWQRATRSMVNADVLNRFSDLAYPAGWAYFLIDCYRNSCNTATTGNCTVP